MGVVLIVDDDAGLRSVFERTVKSLGHRAVTADGVDAALQIVGAEPVDLVLTDWQMEPRDGLALLDALRTRAPALPVVLMSGALSDHVREEALRIGAIAAIDKPRGFQWLRSSLHVVLAAAKQEHKGGHQAPTGEPTTATDTVLPRVLVVEDDEDIREAIALVVERQGCEPICVSHGLEALRYLQTCDRLPSVILLDLMMPVMDGWEFLRRRDERAQAIPVVVITAGATSGLPENVRCLRKPVSVDVLAAELRPCWAPVRGSGRHES